MVVDDHQIVRDGLVALLGALDGAEVVGTAEDGREALHVIEETKPDVVVMDIQMPDRSGIDATRDIRRAAPDVAVLMLTMFDDDASIFAAMRAGARGYVLKGDPPDHVVRAIAAVAAGEAIFGPGVARQALSYLSRPRTDEAFPELTRREREVLDLIAKGLGNATIATRLALAPATVGNHITSIFAKLQVASRSEAIVRARSEGLGT